LHILCSIAMTNFGDKNQRLREMRTCAIKAASRLDSNKK
jgi:hypothetical protein